MKKAGVLVCLLAGIAMAGTKSFNVTLAEPSIVAGTELKPGDYTFRLEDQKLIIKHGREVTEASVKVENTDTKFSSTKVTYDDSDGKYKLQEICVGGTHMKLVVGGAASSESSSSQ
jgi:hypothetical protein